MSTPELESGQAVLVDWTEREYFTDRTALGRSSIIRVRDPSEFEHVHELGLPLARSGENASMALGTSTHLAILEPQEWVRRAGIPEIPRPKGRKGSKKITEWEAAVAVREQLMSQVADRLDLSVDEMSKTSALTHAVWSHSEASALLGADGYVEQTILWREPTSGMLIKVRVDKLALLESADVYGTALAPGLAEVDLKSAKSVEPRSFRRSVRDYGYDIQASLYCDAVEAAFNARPVHYWIAVCNTANRANKHHVAVYMRSDEAHEAGRSSYRALLAEIKDRRQTNNWRAEWETGAHVLDEWIN